MADVEDYEALIPNYNAVQPKFMAELQALLRPLVTLQNFLTDLPQVFDLDTAIGTQLDQVGIWIGRNRFVATPIEEVYFSWEIEGLGWEQGTWQGAFDPDEGLTQLDDETFRQLLYAKVRANTWDGSIRGIVEALNELFAAQNVTIQVIDNQDMSMEVDVTGLIQSAVFRALLIGGYIPIKPVGVAINYNFATVSAVVFRIGYGRIGLDFIG